MQHNHPASVWAVMMRMGCVLGHDELNSDKIHRLENVMTLRTDLHGMLDTLLIWLEATVGRSAHISLNSIDVCQNVINQYTVHATIPSILAMPAIVTFHAQAGLPLPDPRYLALHATCARVAHLSGAGEYIDAFDRDIDTTRVLAKDGSSAKLLAEALSSIRITAPAAVSS